MHITCPCIEGLLHVNTNISCNLCYHLHCLIRSFHLQLHHRKKANLASVRLQRSKITIAFCSMFQWYWWSASSQYCQSVLSLFSHSFSSWLHTCFAHYNNQWSRSCIQGQACRSVGQECKDIDMALSLHGKTVIQGLRTCKNSNYLEIICSVLITDSMYNQWQLDWKISTERTISLMSSPTGRVTIWYETKYDCTLFHR